MKTTPCNKEKSVKKVTSKNNNHFLKLAVFTIIVLAGGTLEAALSPNLQLTSQKTTVGSTPQQVIDGSTATWGTSTSYGYWQAYGPVANTTLTTSRFNYTTTSSTWGIGLGTAQPPGPNQATVPSTAGAVIAAIGAGTITGATGTAGAIQIGSSSGGNSPAVAAMVFEKTVAGAYSITTAAATVANASITINGSLDSGDSTFAQGTYGIQVVSGATAPTFTNAGTATTTSINIILAANQIWQNAGVGTMLINDSVSGGFTLTTKGAISFGGITNSLTGLTIAAGQTTFAGTSGFTQAATVVNGGTLDLAGTSHSIGTGALTLQNGTIQNGTLTAASYGIQSGTISGSLGTGVVTKTTTGTVNMTGANSGMTGTVGVNAGTLEFNTSLGSGAVTVNAGTLQYDGTTLAAINGGLTMSGSTTLSLTGGGNGGISSTGAVALGTASQTNFISLSGLYTAGTLAAPNSYTLINTTGTGALTTPGTLQFTGSTLGNSTVGANGTATVGRTQYVFTTTTGTAGSVVVAVSGGGIGIIWNGGSSGTWNDAVTANTIWNKVSDTNSSTPFYNNDSPTFGSGVSPTVTVASGGVAPATTTFSGINGDVATITNAGVSSATITNQSGIVNSGAGKAVLNTSISGNGGVTNSGTGEIDLNNNNTYTGATTVSGGKIVVGSAGSLGTGAVNVTAGTLDLGGTTESSTSFVISGGKLTNGAITAQSYALNGGQVGATIGAGAVTVGNNATTTLSGSATAASSISISSGATLALGASGVLSSAAFASQPGTLNLNGFNQSFGALTGNGPIKTGTGTLTWGISVATPSYTGLTTIDSGGAVVVTNSISTTIPASLFTGSGTVVYSPSNPSATTSSAKQITLTGENTTFTGTSLLNNAQVNFSGVNGSSIVDAFGTGPIAASNGTGLVNIKFAGAVGSYTIANEIYTGTATEQFKVSPVVSSTFTLSGVVSGAGTLSQGTGGTVIVANANNTFTGGYLQANGVTQIASGSALGAGPFTYDTTTDGSSKGIIRVTGTTEFTHNINIGRTALLADIGEIDVDSAKTFTVSGNILNATNASYSSFTTYTNSGLTKGGAGTLVLTGQNSYSGATTVSSGVLAMDGTNTFSALTVLTGATLAGHNGSLGAVSLNSGATLNPDLVSGARSLLNVTSLSLGSTTTLDIEYLNAPAGTGYDQIQINGGALTYSGALNINSLSSLATLFGGASQSVVLFSGMVNPTTGTLTSVVFNQSGQAADTFASSGTGAGVVWTDQTGNYTFTPSTGTLAVIMVPEPGTCAMVGLGLSALAVTIIRRRRND